jgi:hypothetical protein
MDLYEALKSGTPADELVATFTKELEAAKAKLKEETEAEQITEYREYLAEAIYDYISALIGFETPSFTVADIEKELKDIEKDLDPVLTLLSGFASAKKEDYKLFKTESKAKTDGDILAEFIKSLK